MSTAEQHWSTAAARSGPIEIRLPADADLVSAIRLTASGMASTAKCTLDEIDDIKLAVSEVLLALIEHGSARTLTLTLQVGDGEFAIVGRGATRSFDPDHPDLVLSKTVLAEVCSAHSIDLFDSEMRISATVRLRRTHAC